MWLQRLPFDRNLVGALTLAVVTVTACGGDSAVQTAVEQASDGQVRVNDDGNVELELDDDTVGEIGSDLDLPDWVPDGFPLPDDLDIYATETDGTGARLAATTSAVDEAGFQRSTIEWLQANGYEIVLDFQGAMGYEFVARLGEDVFEGELSGSGLSLRLSQRDIDGDVQRGAETQTGPGIATLSIGGVDDTFEGLCEVTGSDFLFSTDDDMATVEVEISPSDDGPFGSALVLLFSPAFGGMAQYTVTYPQSDPADPMITTDGSSARIEGTWYDSDLQPVTGSLDVACSM